MIRRLYTTHRQVAHDFFWRNIQTFGKQGFFLLMFFYAAHVLSPQEFGFFNYILAIAGLLLIFCDFGFSASVARYVAEYRAVAPARVARTLSSVALLIAAATAIIMIILAIWGEAIFRDNFKYIALLLPFIFCEPMVGVLDGFYRGAEEFRRLAAINLVVLGLSVPVVLFLISAYGLIGAIVSIDIVSIALMLGMLIFRRETSLTIEWNIVGEISRYGIYIGIANVGYFLYTQVDILILKQFGYLTEIGYYGIINSIFAVLLTPAVMLGQVIAPKTSKRVALGDHVSIEQRFLKSIVPFAIISLFLGALIFVVAPVFLRVFLPKYYTPAFIRILGIMLLLLPFKLWGVFTVNAFITPGGFVKIVTVFTLIAGAFNVAFDYFFIGIFGFIGVFIGTLLVHSLNIIGVNIVFYRSLQKAAAKTI